MTFDTMYDSAYPQTPAPATDVVLIYIGGDTPHVWTDAEIAAQPARFRLPCWVRSNPPGPGAVADAEAAVAWLVGHGVPRGCAIVLDLETAVNPAYVSAFGAFVRHAGYLVLVYGSRSTLYQNPQLDGYFDAHPGDAEQVDPGNVATQYGYLSSIDLDVVSKTVPLWDTKSSAPTDAPAPQPTPAPQEAHMAISPIFEHGGQKHVVQAAVGSLWHKWLATDGWHNETLAGPDGGTAGGCAGNKVTVANSQPGITIDPNGDLEITFEGTDNSAWNVAQGNGSSEWLGGKLP